MLSDLVFLDTETLGVHIDAPIWELAAVRRAPNGTESTLHMFIHHNAEPWLTGPNALPEQFAADYRNRFDPEHALGQSSAAGILNAFLAQRPHIVGAVPNFDTERISRQLFRPANIPDPWHYHLIDVENLAVGFLAGRAMMGDLDAGLTMPDLPWNSNDLSRAIGVDPDEFVRLSAMGDVRWAIAQFDAIMGGAL